MQKFMMKIHRVINAVGSDSDYTCFFFFFFSSNIFASYDDGREY